MFVTPDEEVRDREFRTTTCTAPCESGAAELYLNEWMCHLEKVLTDWSATDGKLEPCRRGKVRRGFVGTQPLLENHCQVRLRSCCRAELIIRPNTTMQENQHGRPLVLLYHIDVPMHDNLSSL